jgi:hypothetical protein
VTTLVDLFVQLVNQRLPFRNPKFETQQSNSSGRNDVVITDDDVIIVFENKWDSQTYLEQLHRYDNELTNKSKQWRFLIHLTKDYEQIGATFANRFKKISWSELYNALKRVDPTDKYLRDQFLLFLEEGGIAMEKVSWEIVNGAKSIYSLIKIIDRACEELGFKSNWGTTSNDYTSQWIPKYNLGVYFYHKEASLYFTSATPIHGVEMEKPEWLNNQYAIKFDFDTHCFFHKNLEEQIKIIKNFILDLSSKLNLS